MNDPKIVELRAMVDAAQREFDMAVAFHESWKPMAYDADLHQRMGKSKASQTFLVIRMALRREMVLALVRLWDTATGAIKMTKVAEILKDKDLVAALGTDRAEKMSSPAESKFSHGGITQISGIEHEMREDIAGKAKEARCLIFKYMEGGKKHGTHVALRNLRNEQLAHHQVVASTSPAAADCFDERIEEFYNDNSTIVAKLLGLVNGLAYDPADTGRVFRVYAETFWINARGEMTEGHPKYRPPYIRSPAGT